MTLKNTIRFLLLVIFISITHILYIAMYALQKTIDVICNQCDKLLERRE